MEPPSPLCPGDWVIVGNPVLTDPAHDSHGIGVYVTFMPLYVSTSMAHTSSSPVVLLPNAMTF